MSEEKRISGAQAPPPDTPGETPGPAQAPPPEPPAPDSGPPRAKNGRSAIVYLIVLVGAAFFLLLFAYLMQQRSSEEIMGNLSDLRESMGNISSIDQLVEDNQALREEVEALKDQAAALDSAKQAQDDELTALQGRLESTQALLDDLENRMQVLTSFAVLEQALRDENYDIAAGEVLTLCRGNRDLDLGIVDADGARHFDAKARLAEIIPLLERQGALEKGQAVIP